MQVVQVEDGMQVQPNCVYVIPPNADLAILHGKLQVLEPSAPRGLRTPIDFFFRRLAEDQKEKAIASFFPAWGATARWHESDQGTSRAAMVQDPASAKFDGMPRSAINTGVVDYVASAEELPAKLTQYAGHLPASAEKRVSAEEKRSNGLEKVFVLLRAHGGKRLLLLQEEHDRPAD